MAAIIVHDLWNLTENQLPHDVSFSSLFPPQELTKTFFFDNARRNLGPVPSSVPEEREKAGDAMDFVSHGRWQGKNSEF